MAENDFIGANQNVLFDLRQTYAIKILEPILLMIEDARRNSNFISWYEELTLNLYTNIFQKLNEIERGEYENILKETNKVLSNNESSYLGRSKELKGNFAVRQALQKLEMWMKDKMETTGLYGKGYSYDEDEI